MKTPISYYGGKQRLVSRLLPMIPKHRLYCEPFFGGGALFFAKPQSDTEVINDTNGEAINFYATVKKNFKELAKEIQCTLVSRELFQKARNIYENPKSFTPVKRAWAFWTLASQGFANLLSSWAVAKDASIESKVRNKVAGFTEEYSRRLQHVRIECNDALRVIELYDAKDAFFYLDPPYINSHQGHYKGYTEEDYTKLLERLSKLKGKFLLSSYPSAVLKKFIAKNKWEAQSMKMAIAVTKHTDKMKTEMFVANYPLGEVVKKNNSEVKRSAISSGKQASKLIRKLKSL
ncbi:MAG: DNA adenine methylase [Cytophagaceae bacterium]|jgi:DNA adenine methylase|nr:DNA adenine methylase [Cytophagaceae bacterium]